MATAPIGLLSDRTTWAKRNASQKIQPTCEPSRKLTDAEKASRQLSARLKKQKQAQLNDAVGAYIAERTAKLQELADEHSVKVAKIEDMVNAATHYKKPRTPSLANAIVHYLAKTINDDLSLGERKSLAELKQIAQEDPELQPENLSEERKKELLDDLAEARADKKTSARASNRAAARDVQSTIDRVTGELDSLFIRTGFSAWLLGARNSVNDESPPTFFGSGDAVEFPPEVLSKDPWELARLFEQWTCSREKNLKEIDTIARVRTECSGYVRVGLRNITNVKNLEMNYANYERVIVLLHGVKVVGWPLEMFVSPSDITNIIDMRKLRDAWKTGACKWVRLTQGELDAHATSIEAREKNGEVVGKPRKKRSDAGVIRGKRKRADKENVGTKAKRSKASRRATKKASNGKSRKPSSAEFVISSDEEDDDQGEGGEDDSGEDDSGEGSE